MSKHTEGPWLYTDDQVVDEYGGTIADASARRHFPGVEGRAQEVEAEIQANVRLMAAAPELLVALKDLADWCDNIPDSAGVLDGFGDVMDEARAAIAKAEGRA